jgi:hypothetical protein
MNRIHKPLFRPTLVVLALALALVAVPGARSQASASAAYGAEDYYLLVKSCSGPGCAAAANWTPAVTRMQQQFRAEGWGNDSAVGSRNQTRGSGWAGWAAAHLYYIDGNSGSEIRALLASTYQDLRAAGAIHVIRVAVAR